MDSLDLQVLRQARDWHRAGPQGVAGHRDRNLGLGAAPARRAAGLRGDGLVVGSVSGGCVEDDLIERVRNGERVDKPSLVTYGVTKEEAARFGLPCGGNLRLVQEPLLDVGLDRRGAGAHRAPRTGGAHARPRQRRGRRRDRRRAARSSSSTAATLRALFGPRWRLLIIGAGQLSRVLAQMALALDFEVICCDPREEYHLTWDVPGTTFSKAMPDDLVLELQLDPHSAVVARDARPQARRHGAARGAQVAGLLHRRARLARQHREAQASGWRCSTCRRPRSSACTARSGLDLGSKTPAEIAVSIAGRDRRGEERRGAGAEEGRLGCLYLGAMLGGALSMRASAAGQSASVALAGCLLLTQLPCQGFGVIPVCLSLVGLVAVDPVPHAAIHVDLATACEGQQGARDGKDSDHLGFFNRPGARANPNWAGQVEAAVLAQGNVQDRRRLRGWHQLVHRCGCAAPLTAL